MTIPSRMSEAQFVKWYDKEYESIRAEWVAGEVIVHMPDNVEHFRIEDFIYFLLREFVIKFQLGEAFRSRIQVRVPVKPSRREPDIFFVSKSRSSIVQKKFVDGPPEMAIEIISPSSRKRDTRVKFLEYEEAGVKECWIIDPEALSIQSLQVEC